MHTNTLLKLEIRVDFDKFIITFSRRSINFFFFRLHESDVVFDLWKRNTNLTNNRPCGFVELFSMFSNTNCIWNHNSTTFVMYKVYARTVNNEYRNVAWVIISKLSWKFMWLLRQLFDVISRKFVIKIYYYMILSISNTVYF